MTYKPQSSTAGSVVVAAVVGLVGLPQLAYNGPQCYDTSSAGL